MNQSGSMEKLYISFFLMRSSSLVFSYWSWCCIFFNLFCSRTNITE